MKVIFSCSSKRIDPKPLNGDLNANKKCFEVLTIEIVHYGCIIQYGMILFVLFHDFVLIRPLQEEMIREVLLLIDSLGYMH